MPSPSFGFTPFNIFLTWCATLALRKEPRALFTEEGILLGKSGYLSRSSAVELLVRSTSLIVSIYKIVAVRLDFGSPSRRKLSACDDEQLYITC